MPSSLHRRLDRLGRALAPKTGSVPIVDRIVFQMPDNGRGDRALGEIEVCRPGPRSGGAFVVTIPPPAL